MKPAAQKRPPYEAVTEQLRRIQPLRAPADVYSSFDGINGSHPWKDAVPNGWVEYEARILRSSRVVYFNFALAKEMGLLPADHPDRLNQRLERKLIETFSLRIINEYDVIHNVKYPRRDVKPGKYMATRYLQLQHDCRQGTTSGDGRSLWNGCFEGGGAVWDISSCGTGVTRLAPGMVEERRAIRTGDPRVSYGSGLADVDEGLSAAILSESFHARGILTERTLLVVEGPVKGTSVNVRAAKNLIRPSHLFLHYRQGNWRQLKAGLDHFIARQINNGEWRGSTGEERVYDEFLRQVAENYARFAAALEDEYVFCWLEWDGDNMLTMGGIIDYGSIRQFGLCHHHYRYDDVHQFSTSLREQRRKARYLVQSFAQLVHYVKTGRRRGRKAFASSDALRRFDETFRLRRDELFLRRMGLNAEQREHLIRSHRALVERFVRAYVWFEGRESGRGMRGTPDGKNWPVAYDAHALLRELPKRLLSTNDAAITTEEFLGLMRTEFTSKALLGETRENRRRVEEFLSAYHAIVDHFTPRDGSPRKTLVEMIMRAGQGNRQDLVTGDGIISVVDRLLTLRSRLKKDEFVKLVDAYIDFQCGRPGIPLRGRMRKLYERLVKLTLEMRHTI
ncbi:MAG: YdiU family protein [Bdellovibrionales bacterium]|nr:YdiU family protein [Bdellovibrionales bacterium]